MSKNIIFLISAWILVPMLCLPMSLFAKGWGYFPMGIGATNDWAIGIVWLYYAILTSLIIFNLKHWKLFAIMLASTLAVNIAGCHVSISTLHIR